ncbi:MAG: dihydropteroate synthase [Rhodobacteraceae bacterium]|jgi:5-methyltetrahydrofolate--homocysteine methyltransferase|nr:dihydropteroate synthase [Paracoccaceae bacterium]
MDDRFIVIGENTHATRVLMRKSPRIVGGEGQEAIAFPGEDGTTLHLPVPDAVRRGQDFEEGRVKHIRIAILAGMGSDPAAARLGRAYITHVVRAQEAAGAHFLDLNVDEMSIRLDRQQAAMDWLVRCVQEISRLPLSVDSSNLEIIATGLAACAPGGPRPMVNSASLERLEALDLARDGRAAVVVTAAGEKGMPAGIDDRVANASRMVEAALARAIPPADIHIDPLIFPVSVDASFPGHALGAMRALRDRWGPEIHITGGFSNVSFGIPYRRAINDAFLRMAVEAGASSGIIDPVMNPPSRAFGMQPDTLAYRLAEDVLAGRDEHCRAYIGAWRRKEI